MENISTQEKLTFEQVWKKDIVAGFLVFLLALPLSLGIAKASGFPAAMGVLTAMIGGLSAIFFRVSPLTIKGPAAGLITICAAAIVDFGGGEQGWKIAAAAITVSSIFQVAMGFLKFGSFGDLFPITVVRGMLSSIGIIITVKQIPVLLGIHPELYSHLSLLELFFEIPSFFNQANLKIAVVGILGLLILFAAPQIKSLRFQKIPPALIVLSVTIPLALFLNFKTTEPNFALVEIGDFWGQISLNISFDLIGQWVFWKYVLLFLFVGTLESLLTVKAIDNLDPYQRRTNANSDLKALGFGNFLSGLLGGLPMISEVVRSSSNITFGAKSKWSNIFHGSFLLLAMLFLIPWIEMIPNTALAAMLIFAGYRLAAPLYFVEIWKSGKEQLTIFLTTIIVTLATDLLLGIFAGIFVKMMFQRSQGIYLKQFFFSNLKIINPSNDTLEIRISDAALFTHIVKSKRLLEKVDTGKHIRFYFDHCRLIDQSYLAFITQFKKEYEQRGGVLEIIETLK